MLIVFIDSLFALQEYQDHPSDEEEGDLYEKIASGDAARDDRFGSATDKRRCRLHGWRHQFWPSWNNSESVYKCLKLFSHEAERHTFIQLGGGHRPKKGSNQADEVPHETSHAAVRQGERIHPR